MQFWLAGAFRVEGPAGRLPAVRSGIPEFNTAVQDVSALSSEAL